MRKKSGRFVLLVSLLLCHLSASLQVDKRRKTITRDTFYGLSREELVAEHERHLKNLKKLENSNRSGDSLSWSTPENVTCPELDWTFKYQEPFLHLALPVCGQIIQPKMVLYRPGKSCDLEPFDLPNNITDDCVHSIMEKNTNVEEVIIMVHGFLKSFSNSYWMHDLSDALLNLKKSSAVLIVGWGHGSGGSPFPDPFYYYQAAANTRYMGVAVAKMLEQVVHNMEILTNSAVPASLHCIGHSLGAHICGFVGKTLATLNPVLKLRRISGLDPAGPLFAPDVPYPFNFVNISEAARLNPSDAGFVDVIHTDGKARFTWSVVPQYGTMTRLGHVDFFPGASNEFGWNQPGCWQVQDIGSCSHSRSHELYLSSLTAPCHATQMCGETEPLVTNCSNITTNAPIMGYAVDKSSILPAEIFTVETVLYSPPFCNMSLAQRESHRLKMDQTNQYQIMKKSDNQKKQNTNKVTKIKS